MKKSINRLLLLTLLLCMSCTSSFKIRKISVKIDDKKDIGLTETKNEPYLLVEIISDKDLLKVEKDFVLQIRNIDKNYEAFGTLYKEEGIDKEIRLNKENFETKEGLIKYTLRFDRLKTFYEKDDFLFKFYIIGVNKAPGWWPTSNVEEISSKEFIKALKEYKKRKTEQ